VWQRGANGKVGPPVAEAFPGLASGDIKRVLVDGINLSQSFDQMRRIALVPGKPTPNRVGINRDTQVLVLPWIKVNTRRNADEA
jgi:hypothetical protein